MSNSEKLIVRRGYHQLKDDTGIVYLILIVDEQGKIQKPSSDKFPTGTIWISSGYDDVEQKFKSDELFIIDEFFQSDDNPDDSSAGNKAKHWALGKRAQKMEAVKCIPVIEAELPDIGSGLLRYDGTIPSSEQFFIINEEYLYGPFAASQAEDEIVTTPNPCLPLHLPPHHIAKISKQALIANGIFIEVDEHTDSSRRCGYISAVKDIATCLKDEVEKIDFINNAQLISFFGKKEFGQATMKPSRKAAEQLKNAIAQETKQKHKLSASEERLKRLNGILDQYLSEPEFGLPVINNWLATDRGREFLERLIEKRPEVASPHTESLTYEKNKLEEDLDQLRDEKRRLELEQIDIKRNVEKERQKAKKEVDEIHQQKEQELQEQRQKLMAGLEAKIKDKRAELSDIEIKVSDIQAALKKNIKIEELDGEISYLTRREADLKLVVTEQEKLLRSSDLANEVAKIETILEILRGRDFGKKQSIVAYKPSPKSSERAKCGASIVQAFVNEFDEGGRAFTFEEMANLFITIQQSFMTVLKGLPGAGKTSTAIRLAQAHRLTDNYKQSDNFLNVPVSRGWVSGRDFIGFYNALKGSYQPAKTGMYQFLRHGKEISAESTLRLVLLDEANLSPIEHYMSDFLGLFDAEGRGRPIDTGMSDTEQRYIQIPTNLRFIATINNDATTEALSPRLCDRVPIISMDIDNSQSLKDAQPFQLDGSIEWCDLERYFGIKKDSYDDLPAKLEMIVDLFGERNKDYGQTITVSQRKVIAMRSFYYVAREYMDDTIATDFAVSQYMLPLINGFGKNYRNRIEKISEQSQRSNLTRTQTLLEDILANGDSHIGSYSFF